MEKEVKDDRIRQLRAENTVHKKHITIFDPTQTSNVGILDEISYMEMKVKCLYYIFIYFDILFLV